MLDPFVSFGAPTVVGHGAKTANVHDLFVAENEKVAAVRAWWELTEGEVEAAVEFERRFGGTTLGRCLHAQQDSIIPMEKEWHDKTY